MYNSHLGFSNMMYVDPGIPLDDEIDTEQQIDTTTVETPAINKTIVIPTKKPFPWWILVVGAAWLYFSQK